MGGANICLLINLISALTSFFLTSLNCPDPKMCLSIVNITLPFYQFLKLPNGYLYLFISPTSNYYRPM